MEAHVKHNLDLFKRWSKTAYNVFEKKVFNVVSLSFVQVQIQAMCSTYIRKRMMIHYIYVQNNVNAG